VIVLTWDADELEIRKMFENRTRGGGPGKLPTKMIDCSDFRTEGASTKANECV
jgi:hypothetical protein